MKKVIIILVYVIAWTYGCKKESTINTGTGSPHHNSDVYQFLAENAPAAQTFTINGSTGGGFVTPQGTTVAIPPNAFITQNNVQVSGVVTIAFKDLYKKSDMFFSRIIPMTLTNLPLKSAGEFFIKAVQNGNGLLLASGKKIEVTQPAGLTGGIDFDQKAFNGYFGDMTNPSGWWPAGVDSTHGLNTQDSVRVTANAYVFSMYSMSTPADSGTWCNSDNASYFSAFQQTLLEFTTNHNDSLYDTQVYLIFKSINSMVHIYANGNGTYFPYPYAPIGLQCTMVAVGVKDGRLYSSFVPLTIGINQNVSFTLSQTTTQNFKSQLQALN